MKAIILVALSSLLSTTALSQGMEEMKKIEIPLQSQLYSYIYVEIRGKSFSKKLHVEVDLGDTPEQIELGKQYSLDLNNKKSYAAVLNALARGGYELVQTYDLTMAVGGNGGTYGVVYIMKRKELN